MQGDIGVARSTDKGATWEQLGVALDEDWHLSYPYVFDYNGNVSFLLPQLFICHVTQFCLKQQRYTCAIIEVYFS